jgi:two-component system, sporulation sensor kinase D
MNFNASPQFARWFIIISSLIITTLILWNVSLFFDQLKEAERSKMEVYSAAVRAVEETLDIVPKESNRDARTLERSLYGLYLKVTVANTTIPTILRS